MWLAISEGDGESRVLEVRGDRNVVGSDPSVEIVMGDEGLEPRHAELRALPDGRLEIRDLDSDDGTYVGGIRIEGPATLEGGETIRLGKATLEVSRERPSPDGHTGTTGRRATVVAIAALGLAALAIVLAVTGVFSSNEEKGRLETRDLVAKVRDGTALVVAYRGGLRRGNGTGWVLDAGEGLVVTNAHVVDAGETFDVVVGEDRQDAEVVGVSPCDDLAVLRVEETAGLTQLPLGTQADLAQGDSVIAVGYPVNASPGDELQVTTGIVSVVSQSYDVPGDPFIQLYPNVIQTDAPINPGNSGGPLVDSQARVVGINTLIFRGQQGEIEGQGYAIGVDDARDVLETLRTGDSIGWGGFAFSPILPRQAQRQNVPPGLLVTAVVPGTPAAEAGLSAENAIVVAVDGKPVQSFRDYCSATEGIEPGARAQLNVLESGGPRVVELEL